MVCGYKLYRHCGNDALKLNFLIAVYYSDKIEVLIYMYSSESYLNWKQCSLHENRSIPIQMASIEEAPVTWLGQKAIFDCFIL